MTCHDLVDQLADYLAGDLAPARHAAFEHHLVRCPDCLAYLRTYRDTIRLTHSTQADDSDCPDDLVATILAAHRARG